MFKKFGIFKIVKILAAVVVICFGTAAILITVCFGWDFENPKNNFVFFSASSNNPNLVAIDDTKTSPIAGIDSIKISNSCADVSIQTCSDRNIQAHLYGRASNNIKLDIKKVGSMLLVDVNIEKGAFSSFSCNGLKLDIQIPSVFKDRFHIDSSSGNININSPLTMSNIRLESSSGDINSSNSIQTQECNVNVSSGNINMNNITCNKSSIKSTSGTIKCKGISSKGDITLHAFSGDISLENITAENLGIGTSSGSINLINIICKDSSSYTSSSGGIGLNSIKTKDISINTKSGTVKGNVINAEKNIELGASSGDITLNDVKGNIKSQSSSGSLKINYSTFNNNSITTSANSGDVTIGLPGNSVFTLNSKASTGDIRCDFPITINSKNTEHSLNGSVGGGQNIIEISTSSGNISILKK